MISRSRLVLVLGFAIVALVCARLGFWQLERLRERRASNRAAQAEREKAPVVLDSRDTVTTALVNRRVQVTGRYAATDIVLRNRVYQGVPGVELVSPLVLDGGRTAVLVNRGFVPSPDATTVAADSLREPGAVRVEGIALTVPSGTGAPVVHGGKTTWAALDRAALEARLPYRIASVYVRQTPDSARAGFPRRLDPPPLDEGPHLSYAIQWFAFSVMAVVFGILLGTPSDGARGRRSQGPKLMS